jgi:HlyD family secretion protein
MKKRLRNLLILAILAAVVGTGSFVLWQKMTGDRLREGIVSSNGRLEAIEINISAKTAGRLKEIFVNEGDVVKAGQAIAQMDITQLLAQKRQATAQLRRSEISISSAMSMVAQKEAERASAQATVEQRQAELDAAKNKLARSEQLIRTNAVSQQTLDDDRSSERGARAAVSSAQASVAAADAGIASARIQVVDAEAAVEAAKATIDNIEADIADSTLIAPRDGRVQYRIAQPGEVLSSGGRVINMVDLSDVYMTFFLPTARAGRVALGAEVRLVMDAASLYIVPATVSYVADVAQFTPKTVETQEERQKLTFRVRAKIAPSLLRKHLKQVKTGLPGVAYIRLDPKAAWPAFLEANLVQ